MAKYHINPKTGRPNLCNPEKTGVCAYAKDGENPPHYDNKKSAEESYENTAKEEFGAVTTITHARESEIELENRYADEINEFEVFFENNSPFGEEYAEYSLEELKYNLDLMSNNCMNVSQAIATQLEADTISITYEDGMTHHAVSAMSKDGENVIIDYTAAQYDNTLPIPVILEKSKWIKLINQKVKKTYNTEIIEIQDNQF